jgi:hypothetical protein
MYAANRILLLIHEFLHLFKLWKGLALDSSVPLTERQVSFSELYLLVEGLCVSNTDS